MQKSGKTIPVALTEAQGTAVLDVLEERERQDVQFGVQNHHPAYWLAILGKQVGQLGSRVVDLAWADNKDAAMEKLRWEAVQATAVGLALIEAIDRGELPETLATAIPADPRQKAIALGRGDESIHGLSYDQQDRDVEDVDL